LFGCPSSLDVVDFSKRAVDSWAPKGSDYIIHTPPGACYRVLYTKSERRDFSVCQNEFGDLFVLVAGRSLSRSSFLDGSGRSLETPAEKLATHYLATGEIPISIQKDSLAAIVVDGRREKILVARDFFGRRQVFVSELAGRLLVSNDLQLITAVPGIGRALNPIAIADFLRYGLVDFFDKSLTPFKHVASLPPARLLVRSSDGRQAILRFGRFSDLLQHTPTPAPRDIPGAFFEVFAEAVAGAVSGRRVLLSLSGGLDSGGIAACAALALAGDLHERLTAATALSGPEDPEAEYAALTASYIGIKHQFVTVRCEHVLAETPPSWYPNMAFHDHSADSDWVRVAESHDLALIGAAGDSVLWPDHSPLIAILRSYGIAHAFVALRAALLERRNIGLGSGLGNKLGGRADCAAGRIEIPVDVPKWIHEDLISDLQLLERWEAHTHWRPDEELHPTHPQAQTWLQWANWSFSGGNIDRKSPGLEVVDPFLDWRVISFCFSIPPEPWMHQKRILRTAFRHRLPERVLKRPKSPAGSYVIKFLEQLERERLDGWVLSPELSGFVRRDLVPKFSPESEARNGCLNLRPMMLQRWFDGLQRW
jgi:asparagine synthase (glutamine-hydrolysing)